MNWKLPPLLFGLPFFLLFYTSSNIFAGMGILNEYLENFSVNAPPH